MANQHHGIKSVNDKMKVNQCIAVSLSNVFWEKSNQRSCLRLAAAINVQDSVSLGIFDSVGYTEQLQTQVWSRKPYATLLYCRALGLISQR